MSAPTFIRDSLYYGNRPRRALRRAQRYIRTVAKPKNHPRAKVVDAFWFDQFQNFGDALTPWLLTDAGYAPRLATADTAQLIGVGSILEMVPPTFQGAVWGSGLLHGKALSLPDATWLAVRGHLTRTLVSAPADIPLGDPGLLVSTIMARRQRRFSLGIIPHHGQRAHPVWQQLQRLTPGSVVIDPVQRPADVIGEIAACDMLLTSSLHGLITADAFGIPAAWLEIPTDPLRGGNFKFHDYASVVSSSLDRRCELDDAKPLLAQVRAKAATPDANVIAATQRSLRAALSNTPRTLMNPLRSF